MTIWIFWYESSGQCCIMHDYHLPLSKNLTRNRQLSIIILTDQHSGKRTMSNDVSERSRESPYRQALKIVQLVFNEDFNRS